MESDRNLNESLHHGLEEHKRITEIQEQNIQTNSKNIQQNIESMLIIKTENEHADLQLQSALNETNIEQMNIKTNQEELQAKLSTIDDKLLLIDDKMHSMSSQTKSQAGQIEDVESKLPQLVNEISTARGAIDTIAKGRMYCHLLPRYMHVDLEMLF